MAGRRYCSSGSDRPGRRSPLLWNPALSPVGRRWYLRHFHRESEAWSCVCPLPIAAQKRVDPRGNAVTNLAKDRQALFLRAGGTTRVWEPPVLLASGTGEVGALLGSLVAHRHHQVHRRLVGKLLDAFRLVTGTLTDVNAQLCHGFHR